MSEFDGAQDIPADTLTALPIPFQSQLTRRQSLSPVSENATLDTVVKNNDRSALA
jgi:hypothetical protein